MTRDPQQTQARQGRFIALLMAFTGLVWLGVQGLGAQLGLSHRLLAFFDLAALAGFAMVLWLVFGLWRSRRNNRTPGSKD